jgi:hypothetical protein
MKKLNDILTHIESLPEFKKFNTVNSISKFINILPDKLKVGIKFAYVKNETLFFVLSHPVYKTEFKYNKVDIKNLLEKYNYKDISDIDFFVSHTPNSEGIKQEDITTQSTYPEKSIGIFENKISDKKLFSIFENIREIIKNNKKN